MAVSKHVGELLNSQINKEIYSSYLYLTFADYFEMRGLKGYANWYMIQVQEELAHARILRRFLLDNDYCPELEAIAKPEFTFESDLAVLKAAYDHELYITKSINECYTAAREENDYRTMQLLDWFVKEQGEEEANASDMVTNMELFAADPSSLYGLDREYMGRTYVAPTSIEM